MSAPLAFAAPSPELSDAMEDSCSTIAELAREFDLTARALRFYEQRGLLSPRREGATRYYDERERSRLVLILKGKQLGFTLTEIRAMLGGDQQRQNLFMSRDQMGRRLALLKAERARVDAGISELEAGLARA